MVRIGENLSLAIEHATSCHDCNVKLTKILKHAKSVRDT